MTSLATFSHPHARQAITALALPGLIRLVSEIDDNGPVSRGSLGSTFDDLTRHQLRYAIDTARDFGVVYADEQAPARYRLTESGEGLAEVYDIAARWARTYQYPCVTSDFVTRVQCTLKLLRQIPAAGHSTDRDQAAGPAGQSALLPYTEAVLALGRAQAALLPKAEAVFALGRPQAALDEWLRTHPQVLGIAASRSVRTADETERAA